MPLNENEQKILDEIERQMYEDDPKLADKVAKTISAGVYGWRVRLASVTFVVGAVVMFISFTRSTGVAAAGFVTMVVSAGWIALMLRSTRSVQMLQTTREDWLQRLMHKGRN